MSTEPTRIVIAGAGAAGYFAAITVAEALAAKTPPTSGSAPEILLLEAGPQPLAKVRISGGGRCNVTHACFDPRQLSTRYPRGARELLGAFHRWQPRDTIAWFAARGVALKTESDGRMFPVTDNSATIVDCLQRAAERAGVKLRTRCGLTSVVRAADGFQLTLSDGSALPAARLILATGGAKAPTGGHAHAAALGHGIEPPIPSLFTFNIPDPRLHALAGLSVPLAMLSVSDTALRERGPLLVTHWGLSGPAALRLSAWGARELHARDYTFTLHANWLGEIKIEAAREALARARSEHPRRQLANANPFTDLPARLWDYHLACAQLPAAQLWTATSNAALQTLAAQLTAQLLSVTGKSTNKDEFVTCGGVRLSEVDFKTMQSRLVPGLYFAGEVLDIDGITGGFNFQAAWTTAHLAGVAVAESLTGCTPRV